MGAAGIASLPLLQSFKVGANDTIRFGIIGLGQQAMKLMMGFARISWKEMTLMRLLLQLPITGML